MPVPNWKPGSDTLPYGGNQLEMWLMATKAGPSFEEELAPTL